MKACATCRWFDTGLEARLPGLSTLSSEHASVRDTDGLCRLHDRLLRRSACCSAWRLYTDA